MIVLDASINMQDSFDGLTKWDAALRSFQILVEVLNNKSNYGLVAVGGFGPGTDQDPCTEPSRPVVPLISETGGVMPPGTLYLGNVIAEVNNLQPQGGGSIYIAFTLAKKQLEDLPSNHVKSMIFITGSNDTCPGMDEWQELDNILTITDLDSFYNEIIVLDERGLISEKLIERINASSENVNLQVVENNQQLQQVTGNVIGPVNIYVQQQQAILEGRTPPAPAATSAPGSTVIPPVPTSAVILPTSAPPTVVPPTPVPPTPEPPTPAIAWDFTSSNGVYGVKLAGLHYQVFQTATNSPIFTTYAKYDTPNDVKAGGFSPDSTKFAAAYHYGDTETTPGLASGAHKQASFYILWRNRNGYRMCL